MVLQISLSFVLTMNLCSSLQIMIGFNIFSSLETLSCVICIKDFLLFLVNFWNCLGNIFLDKGHSLVPTPPASITGIMFIFLFNI